LLRTGPVLLSLSELTRTSLAVGGLLLVTVLAVGLLGAA
jgi:hypothetical protein